jgi:tetratricopeptide (TPR) repeat protein
MNKFYRSTVNIRLFLCVLVIVLISCSLFSSLRTARAASSTFDLYFNNTNATAKQTTNATAKQTTNATAKQTTNATATPLTTTAEALRGLGHVIKLNWSIIPSLHQLAAAADPKANMTAAAAPKANMTAAAVQNTNPTNMLHTFLLLLIHKGIAIDNLGKHSQAILYFDKALSIDPKNSYALTRKGIALDNLGKHSQAILYFDKALSIDPKNLSALIGKGTALELQGNYTQAIPYIDKALSIDPKNSYALARKGMALDNLARLKRGY